MEDSLHSASADVSSLPAGALNPPAAQERQGILGASLHGGKRAGERGAEPDAKRPHTESDPNAPSTTSADPEPDARASHETIGAAPSETARSAQNEGHDSAAEAQNRDTDRPGGASPSTGGATDPSAAETATRDSSSNTSDEVDNNDDVPQERPEDEAGESKAEGDASDHREDVEANDSDNFEGAEDLDLDAIMAQLQRHTERASAQLEDKDTEELSIEQQLKGALSSLQDLDAEEDDEDDNGDAQFALDQLSQMLNQEADAAAEQLSGSSAAEQGSDHGAQPDDKVDQTQSAGRGDTTSPLQAPSTFEPEKPSAVQHGTSADSLALATEAAAAGASSENTAGLDSHQVNLPEEAPKSSSRGQTVELGSTSLLGSGNGGADESTLHRPEGGARTREYLLAKMPPPPTHLGPLPPMPPPPAALTSPIAPYTALELSRNSRTQSGAGGSDSKPMSPRLLNIFNPTFSEAPSLPHSYESELADQVDTVAEEDHAQEDSHFALLLNDNQTILQARQRCIPLLDALAAQVLDVLSFSHYQETFATVMQPESERGMAYRMLLDSFEDLKRLFVKWKTQSSRNEPTPKPEEVRPFLPYSIPGVEDTRDNLICIQRANLATFVAALFGSIEIGFWELDEWFLKIFVPEGGRLLKPQATIYLDLKTQAYISAVESSSDEKVHKAALDHLFPHDLETKIQDLLGERVILAPSEQDFVSKCHRRRENILAEDPGDLPTRYHWVPFLREVSDYISRNHYTLLPSRKFSMVPADTASPATSTQGQQRTFTTRKQASVPPSTSATSAPTGSGSGTSHQDLKSSSPQVARATTGDGVPSAASAESTDKTLSDQKPKSGGEQTENAGDDAKAGSKAPKSSDTGTMSPNNRRPDIPAEGHPLFPPLPKQVLPPPSLSSSEDNHYRTSGFERSRRPGPRPYTQAPVAANSATDTLAVYEAAKRNAEGTDAIRTRTSMFTTRRTWTKEEEEALLKGMDRVQGPYWAQILELYGPGGKISEVLKDRNQVQLKDKARNLKMFFFRLGLPIPAVFQYVTGDYESRRTSGKRVRDRRVPRAGPSEPPHQQDSSSSKAAAAPMSQVSTMHTPLTNGSSHAVGHPSGAPHSSASPAAQTQGASVEFSNATPSNVNAANPGNPFSESNPLSTSSASVSIPSPNVSSATKPQDGSVAESNATHGSERTAGLSGASSDDKQSMHSATSANSSKAESHLGTNEPVESHGATSAAKGAISPSSGNNDQITEGPARGSEEDKSSLLGETFATDDDKEEDIHSLLSRVGAYVQDH